MAPRAHAGRLHRAGKGEGRVANRWVEPIRGSLIRAGVDISSLPPAPEHISHRCGHSYPPRRTLLFELSDEEWAVVAADAQRSLCYNCHMDVPVDQRAELEPEKWGL